MWPVHLTLGEKKRLLASSMTEPSCTDCYEKEDASHAEAELRPDQSWAVSAETEDATCNEQNHNSRSQSDISDGSSHEVETAPTVLTLKDCWPSSDLSLRWLKQGRSKMHAFQEALRRCLSAAVEPCYWPLPRCTRCRKRPYTSPTGNIAPCGFTTCKADGSTDQSVCNNNIFVQNGEPVLAPEDAREEGSAEGACSLTDCYCTSVRNCALVISEDPLLRLSLLAMSLGITEVHTVVMKDANWESAATVAKCFGRPGNLSVFRSLEALEFKVFGADIAKALSGEAVPPHTCQTEKSCIHKENNDWRDVPLTGITEEITESGVTAEDLHAHLHRYRVVLIDDHYCGPIASAFGLPRLLEFVRTHTCPTCCIVLPRRWQTLMTPAACPPLIASGHNDEYFDSFKLRSTNNFHHKRFAASGRAMRCSSVRLEDVALSDRFCVLESFEMKTLARTSHDENQRFVHGDSSINTTCTENSIQTEQARASTTQEQQICIKSLCIRCAINRQLARAEERLAVVKGNAVCGVEIAGPCAGLIMRSHILLDQGLALPPTAPLMVFLPEEVHLSTRHVMMLGPAPRKMKNETPSPNACICCDTKNTNSNKSVNFTGSNTIDFKKRHSCFPKNESIYNEPPASDAPTSLYNKHQKKVARKDLSFVAAAHANGNLPIPSWRNLQLQESEYCWQWTAICDSARQYEFFIELTFLDLHQTTATTPPASDAPFLVGDKNLFQGGKASASAETSEIF